MTTDFTDINDDVHSTGDGESVYDAIFSYQFCPKGIIVETSERKPVLPSTGLGSLYNIISLCSIMNDRNPHDVLADETST